MTQKKISDITTSIFLMSALLPLTISFILFKLGGRKRWRRRTENKGGASSPPLSPRPRRPPPPFNISSIMSNDRMLLMQRRTACNYMKFLHANGNMTKKGGRREKTSHKREYENKWYIKGGFFSCFSMEKFNHPIL